MNRYPLCRWLMSAVALLALPRVAPCQAGPERVARIDEALAAGQAFIVARQSPDGAWRSGVYGMFKDGPSLSPRVLLALKALPNRSAQADESVTRGTAYLSTLLDDKGHVSDGVTFPAYNAAIASRVHADRRSAWIAYLRARQLSAELGWDTNDPPFGGWGYSPAIPRKPGPAAASVPPTSNISATLWALEALREASTTPSDPAVRDALRFVQRCQNFADDPAAADPKFDDGGFFFMPGDAAWNKAGVAGADRAGRVRFNAYGSATADGLRALLDAGLAPQHPRVAAARLWLETRFDPDANPGVFPPDRQVLRNATYFYYAASAAQALARLGAHDVRTARGNLDWRPALADSLIRRQRPDGSWVNPYTDGKEDEPLIATPDALAALTACRESVARSNEPAALR